VYLMTDLKSRVSRIEEKLNCFIEAIDRGIGTTIPGIEGSKSLKETNTSLKRGMKLIKSSLERIKRVYKSPV